MIRMTLAIALMLVGMAFLCIAAFGVARLPDAFQRMHAATKAGGIGTTALMLGVLVSGVVRPLEGLLTIGFVLLTLSVSSQLLSRAAYMSGATLRGLEGRDALLGVLDRQKAPLAERSRIGNGGEGGEEPSE